MALIRILLVLLFATPLTAQELVAPEDVLDMLAGRSVDYGISGTFAGREQFLDRQTVRLRHENGDCLDGTVLIRGSALCFVYEDDPTLHCWSTFRMPDDRLIMRLTSLMQSDIIELVDIHDKPVQCDVPGLV